MMRCHGIEQASDIPLSLAAIGVLALEANSRDLAIAELMGQSLVAAINKDTPGPKTFDPDQNFEPGARNRRPTINVGGSEDARSIMSDEFDGLDATEKAAIRATLIRCRALAAKIANELRNKRPEHFVDKVSLADIHAFLEHVADVL